MKLLGCVALLSLAAAACAAEGENWAVIVAGSNYWSNYRHQAGACHAYQVLSQHGIPDDHIIVMMYDDLAFNPSNPTPGIVINKLGGPNVYENIVKDYTGEDVTVDNFFKVLNGDSEGLAGIGSGKVLKSGPNDRVFINLVDHGGVGLFAFPTGGYLYADDLYSAVRGMYDNGRYKEMVMYMESCESGSMFEDIYEPDMGFYSTTSADPDESSYATYWDDERGTYIGDLYGVCWMENSDENDLTKLTLGEQHDDVVVCNTESNSMWYGQPSIQDEVVGAFMGMGSAQTKQARTMPIHKDLVRSEDVPLAILQKKLAKAEGHQKDLLEYKLNTLLEKREFVREITKEIATLVTGDEKLASSFMAKNSRKVNDWKCYKAAVDAYSNTCFNISYNPYALNMLSTILNMCESGFEAKNIISAVDTVCTFGKMTNIE